ncbi:hypothetical protein XENTR_v10000490 [Xenopus tropicalis]|nr:hypothetical protein XENTR_v10000490 [Xenopus tropicalis]
MQPSLLPHSPRACCCIPYLAAAFHALSLGYCNDLQTDSSSSTIPVCLKAAQSHTPFSIQMEIIKQCSSLTVCVQLSVLHPVLADSLPSLSPPDQKLQPQQPEADSSSQPSTQETIPSPSFPLPYYWLGVTVLVSKVSGAICCTLYTLHLDPCKGVSLVIAVCFIMPASALRPPSGI